MLSKSKIKFIRSLELKKYRKEEEAFVAEGPKLVGDLLGNFTCKLLLATSGWFDKNPSPHASEVIEVTQQELSQASFLKTPQEVLAVFRQKEDSFPPDILHTDLCLALDNVQDPGNLGTIVRLADWFGIEHIFCSPGTADIYSPKAVQATMGAIARIKLHYLPLDRFIRERGGVAPVYGTFLDGENLYTQSLSSNGLIVMGNEGNGISRQVETLVNKKLYIPNYPQDRETTESLNVAIATAIVCAEFRRKK